MLEKVQADRQAKLDKLRELGVDPYGVRYDSAEEISGILDRYVDEQEDQQADTAGRIVLFRDMGKMIFAHLRDDTGQMQIALRKNALDETAWAVAKNLDLGDIIAVSGPLKRTRTGEVTIWADKLTFLCKSLNPMPEKFHGLQDVETRYRQRYLDLMTNGDVMENFKTRVAILDHFRTLLKNKGFLEVETPMLQSICGGAAARPFSTHHNALDIDLFMRISPELYLKRLLVGGMRKVFEINRNFRNEGVDTSHNPEFTLMELYQAYADYEVMMEITEELIATAAKEICVPKLKKQCEDIRQQIAKLKESDLEDKDQKLGELEDMSGPLFEAEKICDDGGVALPYGTNVINYTTPWKRMTYAESLKEHAGVEMADIEAVRAKARELHIEEKGKADAVVINEVFEETVEPYLIQPTFIKDYPADLCPLTRRKPDDPTIALRFEMYMANMEIANAYTELNDPEIQHANFENQLAGEEDGDTMRSMDEDFVTAQRHGMPPAGGLGIGIDRVVMLLTNTQSIRDVILFPLLKPELQQV